MGEIPSRITPTDLREATELRESRGNGWIVIEEYPENMVLGVNIREKDNEFVEELAKSILTQGQIQECTGDTLPDGRRRVWAGQHRFWAAEHINKNIEIYNQERHEEQPIPRFKLRVRVKERQFSANEILEIQIAENLHKDMEPEEEAEAISSIYNLYTELLGKEASIVDFSKRVGLGEAKVGNAVKYVGLDPHVKNLVESEVLLYSVATSLARVSLNKQFLLANKIILFGLDRERAETLIRQTVGDENEFSIFSLEQNRQLEKVNFRLAFRNQADRSAKDAAGYFKRVLRLLDMLEDPAKVEMTNTIRDILATFIYEARAFQMHLDERAPAIAAILDHRTAQIVNQSAY